MREQFFFFFLVFPPVTTWCDVFGTFDSSGIKRAKSYCKLLFFLPFFSVANDRDSNTTKQKEKQDWESRCAARNWNNYRHTFNSDLIWFCKPPLHTARNRCWIQSWIYRFQEFNLLEGWAERIFTCIKAKNNESNFFNYFASCSEINQSSKITQKGRQSHTRQKIQKCIGLGLKYKVYIQ